MPDRPNCSLVIPVFNGSETVAAVVREIMEAFAGESYEVVLVDDGSRDESSRVCKALVGEFPTAVRFVELSRNFGEHSAVLAGLRHARGAYVVVLDDDGQHPAAEALRLYAEVRKGDHDVVYGVYRTKEHDWLRNLGSRLNDRLMTFLLDKPRGLYLSSFKAMNRFLVRQITGYRGAWPYIDGLVLWATRRIGVLDVEHRARASGPSNYTFATLVATWLRVVLNFSIVPLRIAAILGLGCALLGVAFLIYILVVKLWVNPDLPLGQPTLGIAVAFFAGVQLLILGTIGEYLGRLFLFFTGVPQYVVREAVGERQGSATDPTPPPAPGAIAPQDHVD